MEQEAKNHGVLFFVIVIIPLSALYILYCVFADIRMKQARESFQTGQWDTTTQMIEIMQTSYRYSIPNHNPDINTMIQIMQYFQAAQFARENGQYQQALDIYTTIRAEYPDQLTYLHISPIVFAIQVEMADAFYKNNLFDEAEEKYKLIMGAYRNSEAAEIAEKNLPRFHMDWAAYLREEGKFASAIEKYQYILQIFPDSPVISEAEEAIKLTNLEWATSLRENKKYQAALKSLAYIEETWPLTNTAVTARTIYFETGLEYATDLHEKEKYEQEIELLDQLMVEFPDDPEYTSVKSMQFLAYFGQAAKMLESGSFKTAMALFEQAKFFTEDANEIQLMEDQYQIASEMQNEVQEK